MSSGFDYRAAVGACTADLQVESRTAVMKMGKKS